MTMQSLAVDKVDRDGVAVGGSYTSAAVLAALTTHRYEVFRYEQHRLDSSGSTPQWDVVADITPLVHSCTIKFDRRASGGMRSAEMQVLDDGTIDFVTDAVRCFHLVRMPDGNYAQWCMGTFYVPSPTLPLQVPMVRTISGPDALRNLVDAKIGVPFQMPATQSMADYFGHTDDLDDPVRWAVSLIEYFAPAAGVFIDADPDEDRWPESALKTYKEGTAVLDVVNDLLYFAGHDQLTADINGSYVSGPWGSALDLPLDITYIAGPSESYDTSIIVRGSGKLSQDLWRAPNRWIGVVSTPTDAPLVADSKRLESDPDSLLPTGWDLLDVSFAKRGVEVTELFYSNAPTQLKLEAQVIRKIEEGAYVERALEVETPLMPHDYRDKVSVIWPDAVMQPWGDAANGVYILRGWEFPCVAGGRMKHTYDEMPLTEPAS